jgi:tetratricopeptide (TPR) repeat protein
MLRAIVVCVTVAFTATACAVRGPSGGAAGVPEDSLETFMGKVRAQSERARPVTPRAATVEGSDPVLGAALILLGAGPTPARHRLVAREYVRLDILDKAHEHLTAAVSLDREDAAAWDGLARIWRDWGMPHLALPDAYRALYYAPGSAVVHNTLGTVLQTLGHTAAARSHYEMALAIEPSAAYALANLCHGWLSEGDTVKAVDACHDALALRPDLEAARNNLAVAYAASGDVDAMVETLGETGDPARARYNVGVVHLARRHFGPALEAFEEARALRPGFRKADAMARQARQHLQEELTP